MQPLSIYGYIGLGYNLKLLGEQTQKNRTIHDDGGLLWGIDFLLQELDMYNLRVSKSASNDLIKIQERLEKTEKDYKLSSDDVNELDKAISDIDTVIRAESKITTAFILTDKRMDLNKLMYDVPALFSKGTFNKLPDTAQYDFQEAGKCIALERPTAAAFHILRGTESVLRYFYIKYVKPSCTDNLMWGNMTNILNSQKNPSDVDELIKHLDHIRESFRNPTQHPEKIYTLDDAQDLFSLCEDVVNRMLLLI
jgi:hypothetical protein